MTCTYCRIDNDSPRESHCAGPDALSDRQPRFEEGAGSGRASGPAPQPQAARAPSAAPALTGRLEPGLSARKAAAGKSGGSGAAGVEPEAEEVAAAGSDSAPVGRKSFAAAPPPEEEAEAGRWRLGSRPELMTQTRW